MLLSRTTTRRLGNGRKGTALPRRVVANTPTYPYRTARSVRMEVTSTTCARANKVFKNAESILRSIVLPRRITWLSNVIPASITGNGGGGRQVDRGHREPACMDVCIKKEVVRNLMQLECRDYFFWRILLSSTAVACLKRVNRSTCLLALKVMKNCAVFPITTSMSFTDSMFRLK